ncbi:leucine-rich repeat-containing protein [Cavenderia fasciculata]|uniref:Leucine-rich repeat-containing protein n=1 Tax=Cavenderia fasciculata TaxID=261658 RepID=F4Q207_CACFS|nr:leucine-rich repeat-containing protein [Cavenderia fasciculata]EGG18027.1 leucine-rich repeat-containing protein [Cavenderia fasciculata]|eukprot:XP_004356920.1 leucine-rich repeat-containing protein [Cavenderia fasciculata]
MKLTADLIIRAPDSFNPCQDRELNLRGNKISVLENLGATKDQFDTIDFSDNEITRLENMPQMKRLKTLLFNNNHINKIADDFGESLVNLHTLILTNNRITNLADLDALANFPALKYISLLDNVCTKKQNYRLYLVYILPRLKVIDFKKISQEERDRSKEIYGPSKIVKEKLQKLKDQQLKQKTFEPGEGLKNLNNNNNNNNNNGNGNGNTKK